MNHSIVGTNNTPSLTSQQKGFDQNISENVSTVSSKKSKAFEKFKSIVNSFIQFISKYLIDKPKKFFTLLLKKGTNEKKKTDIKEVEQSNIPAAKSKDINPFPAKDSNKIPNEKQKTDIKEVEQSNIPAAKSKDINPFPAKDSNKIPNEKQKTDIKEVEQSNIPDKKSIDKRFQSLHQFFAAHKKNQCMRQLFATYSMDKKAQRLHQFFAACHKKNIPYSFLSEKRFAGISFISIFKVNQHLICDDSRIGTFSSQGEEQTYLSERMGLDKMTIANLYDNGNIIDKGIMYFYFFHDLPSYVGVIKDENHKFLQGESINAHIDDIENIEIEYNGENHILHDVARQFKKENLNCVLYATKEEADKAIKEEADKAIKEVIE